MVDVWFWVLYAIGSVAVVVVLLPLVENLDFWLGDVWQRWRLARLAAAKAEREERG